RHLGLGFAFDLENDPALVWLARHKHGAILPALLERLERFHVQAAAQLVGVMAFHAIASEKRFDVPGKTWRRLSAQHLPASHREQRNQDKSSSHLHMPYRLNTNSFPLSTAQNRSSRISRRVVFGSLAASAMSVLKLFNSWSVGWRHRARKN